MDEWIWTLGLGPGLPQLDWPEDRHVAAVTAGPVPTKLGYRDVGGLRVRCAECGGGSATESILMTSPWPESIFAFAPIWNVLARQCRVVTVDLPGFGGSERDDGLLSPRAMGAFLLEFIEQSELDRPHLVAPDIGTPAALFAASSRPEAVSSLVLGSGGAAVPLQLTGPLAEWVAAPDLDRYRSIDPRAIVGVALDTIEGYEMPSEIREDYLDCYDGDRFVESMRYARAYPDQLPELAGLLPAIETPVHVVTGRRDRVVPLANAEFLVANLPNCRLTILDSGHFVWEEAARDYESIVLDWATGGYREAVSR